MRQLFLTGILLGSMGLAQGQTLVSQTFTNGLSIPEDNPGGLVAVGTFTDASPQFLIAGLTVQLNISGGYNGNLTAYLETPDNVMVELMSQPGVAINGFGASGPGMNITFTDAASQNIQNETSSLFLTGNYHAITDLATLGSLLSPGGRANGDWVLFLTDQTVGGGISTLNSWTLNINTVAPIPEPGSLALVLLGSVAGLRWWRGKKH